MPPSPDEADKDVKGPRRFLKPGFSFGVGKVEWQDGTTLREKAQVVAATRQHRISNVVRVEKARVGMSTAQVAAQIDLGVHQLRRMLRGDSAMPLDVAEAVLNVLGHRTAFKVVELPRDDDGSGSE